METWKLIDFIESVWPRLYAGRPFVRTPVVELLAEKLKQLGSDAVAAQRLHVTFESGSRVQRREDNEKYPLSHHSVEDPEVVGVRVVRRKLEVIRALGSGTTGRRPRDGRATRRRR